MNTFMAACAASSPLPGSGDFCPSDSEYVFLGVIIIAALVFCVGVCAWAMFTKTKSFE